MLTEKEKAEIERLADEAIGKYRNPVALSHKSGFLAGAEAMAKLRPSAEGLVEALEMIGQTEIVEREPDFIWLQRWRNKAKECANHALSAYEAMKGEK